MDNTSGPLAIVFLVISVITFIFIYYYIRSIATYRNRYCKELDNYNKNSANVPLWNGGYTSASKTHQQFNNHNIKDLTLQDFHIAAAYNCCVVGPEIQNGFVAPCALKNAIKLGARFLDFEIYALNGTPVIAASTKTEFNFKQSFNYMDFGLTMGVVFAYAFRNRIEDPCILHFRIKTTNTDILDLMARELSRLGGGHLLGNDMVGDNANNILTKSLKDLKDKVIISVDDRQSNNLAHSLLLNYVSIRLNIKGNTLVSAVRMGDPDAEEWLNTSGFRIILPQLFNIQKNPDVSKYTGTMNEPLDYAPQVVAICFQIADDNRDAYLKRFVDGKCGFVPRQLLQGST